MASLTRTDIYREILVRNTCGYLASIGRRPPYYLYTCSDGTPRLTDEVVQGAILRETFPAPLQ